MKDFQAIEREWRVEPCPELWSNLANRLTNTPEIRQHTARVCDLVLGRYGFESVEKDGFIVRLRGPAPYRLELKERLGSETWRETVVDVGSPDAMLAILRRLGLEPHLIIDRIRMTFQSPKYVICFDDVSRLGKYVEVEEEADVAAQVDPLEDIVAVLAREPKVPAYGDIVRDRMKTVAFRAEFSRYLSEFAFD